jgi:hypothetical protein
MVRLSIIENPPFVEFVPGSQPRRNARGVEPCQYNLNGVAKEEWDCIVSAVKRSEHAFYSYVGT